MDELHMDRPTAVELLEIVAETLSETVVPATAPHAQHQARVAANVCRIIARQLAADPSAPIVLPDSLIEVGDAAAEAAYHDVLALVKAKLVINKPGYTNHGTTEERRVSSS